MNNVGKHRRKDEKGPEPELKLRLQDYKCKQE